MEACGPSGRIHDLAQELEHKTLVCSTSEEAWKWSNVKRKTDKDVPLKRAWVAGMQQLELFAATGDAVARWRSVRCGRGF